MSFRFKRKRAISPTRSPAEKDFLRLFRGIPAQPHGSPRFIPIFSRDIFKLFGIYTLHSFFAALSLNILFSAGACVPIFYAGKRIAGLGVASAAAWLWAIFPNAVIIPFEWIWDTSLSALLVATLLWATLELAESRRVRDWCFYGLLWGFALLTNPAIALLFPVLLAWAAYRIRDRYHAASWLMRPVLAAALALLCCLPWTIRNYVQFHKFIPLRSNFAFELYIGNNENYDDAAQVSTRRGHARPRNLALSSHGRDGFHGRRKKKSSSIYCGASTNRALAHFAAVCGLLDRYLNSVGCISSEPIRFGSV